MQCREILVTLRSSPEQNKVTNNRLQIIPTFIRCALSSQQFAHIFWPPSSMLSTLPLGLQWQQIKVLLLIYAVPAA